VLFGLKIQFGKHGILIVKFNLTTSFLTKGISFFLEISCWKLFAIVFFIFRIQNFGQGDVNKMDPEKDLTNEVLYIKKRNF
jgi:hypothetical protein